MNMEFKVSRALALIGVVVVVFISTADAQDPEIAEIILPEVKRAGLTGSLRCVVINQLDNSVYWIQKKTRTYISKDDTIEIDQVHNRLDNGQPRYVVRKTTEGDNKNIYTLNVTRLERRDAGNYTCQINVRGSSVRTPALDGEIIVLVPPSILPTSTTHTVTVREGTNVNLTCDAEGFPNPNITWVRVNGGLLPSGRLRHMGSLFPITEIATRHRGIYRCLADNAVRPPAVYDTTVLVDFKPVARAVQSSYGQAENRMFDLTIECTIAGSPEPDLQWYRETSPGNREAINNNDKYTVNILLNHANMLAMQERWFQLIIRAVTANDFTNYICEGKNKYGTGTGVVQVFATSECQGPNCPEEQTPEHNEATTSHVTYALIIINALLVTCLRMR